MTPGSVEQYEPIDVAVLIVCYNGRRFLDDCLASVFASDDAGLRKRVVVVDNASIDGSADYVAECYPHVDLIRSPTNLGFAAGNNLGWDTISERYPTTRYLALLNQDTIVESGWLARLVTYLDVHSNVGSAQPLIMLHPETHLINTAGNRSHYLGFGFVTMYRQPDPGNLQPHPIDFCSGAACTVRTSLLHELGLFNPDLFMYLEDAELGWKLRLAGHENHVVPASRIFHKYTGDAPTRHYYYLERNRWILLLTFYKWRTLLLLSPALLTMELAQWVFVAMSGRFAQRSRVLRYFISFNIRSRLSTARLVMQGRRKIPDREWIPNLSGRIDYPPLNRGLVRWLVNPALDAYWYIAQRLIRW